MENKEINTPKIKEQIITLTNRQNLSITATNKIISLKPDLIQLDTSFGGIIVSGDKLELIKLDDTSTRAEILGDINSIKFVQGKSKESFFRKIFK